MRIFTVFTAALCAAIGLGGPRAAWADSPVLLEGADEDTRKAILDLLPDRDRPTTLFEAERIAEEAQARAIAWLRSEGYYDAQVTPETSDNPVSARLVISLGARFTFDAPTVAYSDTSPSAAATSAVVTATERVRAGAPARSADVLEAEAHALAALQDAGYADAVAGERRVVVDHATSHVTVAFNFTAGAPVRLGEVRAEPGDVFQPRFVRSLRNWREGDSYTPERLTRLRRDLTGTGAVSRASTRLDAPNADGTRDVVLEIEPSKRFAYELGLGYSTTEGPGVDAQWTERNLTGRADALTASATLSDILQSVSVELTRPHAAGLGHARSFGAQVAREDTDAYTREGVAIFTSVDAAPRLRLGHNYGLRLSADHFDNSNDTSTDAYVLSGLASIRRDKTSFTLDPRNGSIVDLRIEPSVSTGDATITFARAIAEARIYESVGHNDQLTLAARGRVGWLEAFSGSPDDVPPDHRFYAGGGGSVRGYRYDTIYPHERDALGLNPGGQGLVETSVEARWRFDERYGAVAFLDGGTAFDKWNDATDLSWGVGVGFRYNLGFAPLRVDVAVPLDDTQTSDSYALYISLGQAF